MKLTNERERAIAREAEILALNTYLSDAPNRPYADIIEELENGEIKDDICFWESFENKSAEFIADQIESMKATAIRHFHNVLGMTNDDVDNESIADDKKSITLFAWNAALGTSYDRIVWETNHKELANILEIMKMVGFLQQVNPSIQRIDITLDDVKAFAKGEDEPAMSSELDYVNVSISKDCLYIEIENEESSEICIADTISGSTLLGIMRSSKRDHDLR